MWIYILISTISWGLAEIFYKKGNIQNEKYSHLKTTIIVGIFMGIYALVILFTQDIDLVSFPQNFVRYLPVALCYIVSMICSYFGVRFIEESISDPIENSSCAFVPILCAIFLKEKFSPLSIFGIVLVGIGIVCIGFFDSKGKTGRKHLLGKKLAIWAIAMPFCYLILDAVGTFLDIFYTDNVSTTILINVTENNIEHTANCAYELTFFIVAVILYIFISLKGERLFIVPSNKTNGNNSAYGILNQKWKILAAIFETIGQATYLFALSNGSAISAVILGAGTLIFSLLLSRFVLKEKLNLTQYIFVFLILCGVIILSLVQ